MAILALMIPTPFPAMAAILNSPTVTSSRIYAYSDYGGGDFIFSVQNPIVGCEGGFWLRPTDAGFEVLTALIMTYNATGKTFIVTYYDDQTWPGSPSKFCRYIRSTDYSNSIAVR